MSIRVNGWAQVAGWLSSLKKGRKNVRAALLGLSAIIACASIQPLAVWYWRKDPLAIYRDLGREEWMASPQPVPFKEPLETLRIMWRNPIAAMQNETFAFMRAWSALFLVFGFVALAVSWKKTPLPVKVQGMATLFGLGLLEQAISVPRYMMAFLPFYFFADRLPPWALGALCTVMVWAQCEWAAMFVRGKWAF